MTGLEIIAQNLPSYNENENNDAQGLQLQETRDAAESEIPFGRDDAEEDRSSNQTRGLFNKRGMMILLCIAAIVFLCLVTGLSSAVLTSSNSMVIDSFKSFSAALAPKSPKALPKSPKTEACVLNDQSPPLTPPYGVQGCSKCCDCIEEKPIQGCDVNGKSPPVCECGWF